MSLWSWSLLSPSSEQRKNDRIIQKTVAVTIDAVLKTLNQIPELTKKILLVLHELLGSGTFSITVVGRVVMTLVDIVYLCRTHGVRPHQCGDSRHVTGKRLRDQIHL